MSRIKYIENAGYERSRPMDEDDALEQAETEIRRLKIQVAELQAERTRLIEQVKGLRHDQKTN